MNLILSLWLAVEANRNIPAVWPYLIRLGYTVHDPKACEGFPHV